MRGLAVSLAVASLCPCIAWSYTASTARLPSSTGVYLIVFRSTPLGIIASSNHLAVLFSRDLMCLTSCLTTLSFSLSVPYSRVGHRPFIQYHKQTYVVCLFIKEGRLNLRISEKRLAQLKTYAEGREKTVTHLLEDWIDRLPSLKNDDSDARRLANASAERTRGANAIIHPTPEST